MMIGDVDSHAKTGACLFVVMLVMAFSTPQCLADLYGGTLSVGDPGLIAFGAWNDVSTSLSWDVYLEEGLWHYTYTFTVPNKALSHFIIQVSDTFTMDDLLNLDYDPDGDGDLDLGVELGLYGPDSAGGSNLGMPGIIKGLKFSDDFAEGTEWIWSFDSPREPVWGDFFAINGKKPGTPPPYAYNSGFLVEPDVESGHIAVPDTTVVPISPAVLLGILGLGVAGWKLRKFA